MRLSATALLGLSALFVSTQATEVPCAYGAPDMCDMCELDKSTCASCLEGYYLDNNQNTCFQCDETRCSCPSGVAHSTCNVCASGYRKVNNDLNSPDNCQKCDVNNCRRCINDKTKCNLCQPGYYRESETSCQRCTDRASDNCFSFKLQNLISASSLLTLGLTLLQF